MRKIITALLCAFCLASCIPDKKVYVRSYVVSYIEPAGFEFHAGTKNTIGIYPSRGPGSIIRDYGYYSKGERKEKYDALCEKHNDMSYNRKVILSGATQTIHYHEYLSMDFASIEIISDSDFDDEHPAGESLADIMGFGSLSPAPYIDSGYKKTYNWAEADDVALEVASCFTTTPHDFDMKTLHPFYKGVPELTSTDLSLLGNGEMPNSYLGYLKFERTPTLSKTHNLTITMTTDEGVVYSGTVEMTFE